MKTIHFCLLLSAFCLTASGQVIVGADRVAILDPLNDQLAVIVNGVATHRQTGATPLDGVFVGRDLFVIERDGRAIERFAADGTRTSLPLAADPAVVRESSGRLYVYSRVAGVLQEITTSPFAVARTTPVAPFASTFQADDRDAYFVYPREGKLRLVRLDTLEPDGELKVGAVPTDVAISAPTAMTARTLLVADPSSKRVWVTEAKQSAMQAFARGFVRGFLGLGLIGNRDSQFPTGVDRVFIAGKSWIAYDSSSGTLYRFDRQKSSVIAQNVASKAFTVRPDGVYVWDETVRRLHRIGGDE